MTAVANKGKVGRMLARMAAGAVFGAGSTMLFLSLIGEDRVQAAGPGVALGIVAGLVYALLGILVGLGTMAPNFGARLLNVENAEELTEQRALFGESAISSLLIGIFLLVLSFAGEAIGREVALVVAGICLAGIVVLTVRTSARTDELMSRISIESASLALHATVILLGGWAALAHLGFVDWVGPLAWLALLALLQLAAVFWVCGKRGLLQER